MIEVVVSERFVAAVFLALGTAILGVGWWAVRKYFVPRAEAEAQRAEDQRAAVEERTKLVATSQKLADTVDKLTDRVVALEVRVNALPTESMLHNLNVAITALGSTQQGQQTQLEGISRTLERIQQYLMEHK